MKFSPKIAESRFAGNGFWLRLVMFCLLLGTSQMHGLGVAGFQPASGEVGDEIRISGTGLGAVNAISLNGVSLPLESIFQRSCSLLCPTEHHPDCWRLLRME